MCFRSLGFVCLLCASLAAGIACESQHAFSQDPPNKVIQQVEWEARIEAALNGKDDWDFKGAPLKEVCRAFQKKLGIDVVLDVKSLEDNGIDTSTPITRSLRGISNRSMLRLILNELELSYTLRLGALWITTPEYAEAQLSTKVHPVGDLLVRDPSRGGAAGDRSLLIEAIRSNIMPNSWGQLGGPAAIEGIRESIVISQTSRAQNQVEQFLAAYRAIIASDAGADEPVQTVFMVKPESHSDILAAFDKPLTAEFKDVSLKEVVESIASAMDIPIVIDIRALEDFGLDGATPISQEFNNTPLRFALGRLLHDLELAYMIRDEVLAITTPEESEAQLDIGLYPVRDLVEIGDDWWIEPLGDRCDFDTLTILIQSMVRPDSWDEVGGPSSIRRLLPVPTIVIAQTQEVHEEISELLARLRAAKKLEAAGTATEEVVDPAELIVRSYSMHMVYCAPEEIAKLVVRASDPGTWDDEAGTFIQGLGQSLVVKHNASGHRQVQKLLGQLGVSYLPHGKFNAGAQGFGGGGVAAPLGGALPATPDDARPSPGGFF